jgi:sulfhydrogenase subunit beta (sulfur reductase)
MEATMPKPTRTLTIEGLGKLVLELRDRGFTVIAPTVRDGAIVNAPIESIDQLPRGVGDEQDNAHYRLTARADGAYFGYAAGAQSMKPILFPADELIWRGKRDATGAFSVDRDPSAGAAPYALLGVRGCDLKAIAIQDHILQGRGFKDAHYGARRAEAFIVSVTCGDPAGTCFCTSVGTGPRPSEGYDLSLTEVIKGSSHAFVVDVGSDRGAEMLDAIDAALATDDDVVAADEVAKDAALKMGRDLNTDGLKYLMYANAESPHWDDVASRCLSCTNCTLVCPTCFCTSVEDVSDLTGEEASRHRVWDSCFSEDFSYIHGGSVRESSRSRYRQWITHKLAAWEDQFGMTGCVGCGRCITWCPVGIDITAEAAALRGTPSMARK